MTDTINDHISRNLKNLRKEKGLTLDDLAALCDVSKSMLSEIERGGTNPTILVLWKIAEGMKIPLTRLMAESAPEFTLSRGTHQMVLSETAEYRISTIFPFSETTKTEILDLLIHPGGRLSNRGHVNGVEEVIQVKSGTVRLVLDAGSFDLDAGDAMRFDGNQPHEIINAGLSPAALTNILYYR
jgi:transcriptional regulator with XRE-family HTH domain